MWLIVCSNDHAPLTQAHIFFFKTKNCSYDDLFISLVAMIGLEKCCITSAYLQWLCHSGERAVASGSFVSLPELKAQDELLWPFPVHCPSVHSYLWTTSLKFLGQISSNFMWSLLLKDDWKFVQMVTVSKSRWLPCPYMVKTIKNLLLQNQESFGAESWYKALRTQGLPNLFKWWL